MLYADMRTTLREFAQLGHLVATNGCHRGRQLISPEWIKEMTTPKEKAWGVVPFGYLWYLPKETVQATYGYLCNNLYILPQQEIVFGRCQRQHYLHQSEPFNEELVLSLLHSVLDS